MSNPAGDLSNPDLVSNALAQTTAEQQQAAQPVHVDPSRAPYTAAALHPDADGLADYDKLALVSKGIEETHGLPDMDPAHYFGHEATAQQHLDEFRSMFDAKKNLDLYGADLKAFVQMSPEQQVAAAMKARGELPAKPAAQKPAAVTDLETGTNNEDNTAVRATAPQSVTTTMMAEQAKGDKDNAQAWSDWEAQNGVGVDPHQAVADHLNDLVSKDRFARQNALLSTTPPAAAAFAHDWATSGVVSVDKLAQFPEDQRQSIYQLRNLWSPDQSDYNPVGRALGGAWWGLVKNANSFASSLNVMDAVLGMAHSQTEEEMRAAALADIRRFGAGGALQGVASRSERMATEFPILASYENRERALAGMKEATGVQPAAFGLGTFEPPRYGSPQTTVGKIIYPLFDSVSYLLAYSNPYTGAAATASMMKDARDHGVALGLDPLSADAMGIAVGGTQALLMKLTAGQAGSALKVSELALRQASVAATMRVMWKEGTVAGLRSGLQGLRTGSPELLKSYTSMYALNVGQELAQRFGDDAFIPGEAARADIGQQVVDAAKNAALPSLGFALLPALAGEGRALFKKPPTDVELPELFAQHRRALEALQEGKTPADVGDPSTRQARFNALLADLHTQWIDAPTAKARAQVLVNANLPNVAMFDSYFRNVETLKGHDPRVSQLAPFEFTPENVQKQLPGAKVTAIDEHNIEVEHSIAVGLPAGRIRITREQAAAPTREQTGAEIEKEAGQPAGWFAGLPQSDQDGYLLDFAPRGTTTFRFSSADGNVSMPLESVMWLAGHRPASEIPGLVATGTAGADTFHHEIFHFGMEMLRRSGAMPAEFETTLAKQFPARAGATETFNEEAAADAYAAHVLTPKPSPVARVFEGIRRFFSRLFTSATGRTELDDKVAVNGYFDALAQGKLTAEPKAAPEASAPEPDHVPFEKSEVGEGVVAHSTPENELHHGDVVEVTREDGSQVEASVVGPDKDGNAVVLKHDGSGAETLPEKFVQDKEADHANAVGSPAGIPVGESSGDREGVRSAHAEGGEVAGARAAQETGLPQPEARGQQSEVIETKPIPATTPEDVTTKAKVRRPVSAKEAVQDAAEKNAGFPLKKGSPIEIRTARTGKAYKKPVRGTVVGVVDADTVRVRFVPSGEKFNGTNSAVEDMPLKRLGETPARAGQRRYTEQLAGLKGDERKAVQTNAKAFDDLIRQHPGLYNHAAETAAADHPNPRYKAVALSIALKEARVAAAKAIGVDPEEIHNPVLRARELPKLQAWMEGPGRADLTPAQLATEDAHKQAIEKAPAAPVKAGDLQPGDEVFDARRKDWFIVEHDDASGTVKLRDGTEVTLHPYDDLDIAGGDKGIIRLVSSGGGSGDADHQPFDAFDEVHFQLSQPDMFSLEQQTPEDVAADWAKQQDRKRTDAVQAEIARRQTARLSGSQGSIGQGDLFGADKDELGLTRRFQLSKPQTNNEAEETRQRIANIRALPALPIEAKTITPESAKDAYKALGSGEASDGTKVDFVRGTFGKLANHHGAEFLFRAIPQFKELLRQAIPAWQEPDTKHGPDTTIAALHHYVSKAKIDGRDYYVRFSVQEIVDSRRQLHSAFVTS